MKKLLILIAIFITFSGVSQETIDLSKAVKWITGTFTNLNVTGTATINDLTVSGQVTVSGDTLFNGTDSILISQTPQLDLANTFTAVNSFTDTLKANTLSPYSGTNQTFTADTSKFEGVVETNKILPYTDGVITIGGATDTLGVFGDTLTDLVDLTAITGNLANSTSPLDTVYTTVWSDGNFSKVMITVTLADDATYNLPDASIYGLEFITSDGLETAQVRVIADGTTTIDVNFGTLGTVNSDTDAKVCIYDGGTLAVLKNRTGASKTFYITLTGDL